MEADTRRCRVMSRQLIYTGVTRARSSLMIHGPIESLNSAISRVQERRSGLADLLVRR